MAIKPFAIQGADLTLGGVNLQAGTTGVVIPGVTQATNYRVEEVNDTGDQTYDNFPIDTEGEVIVVDAACYAAALAQGSEGQFASYIVKTDDEGKIDEIEVDSRGTYTQQESSTASGGNMYAYIGSGSALTRPLVTQDWITIPFRPKMRAGSIETIGGGGGVSALENLEDVELSGQTNGQVLMWNSAQEVWKNETISGGAGTGNITFDGNNISSTSGVVEISADEYAELSSNGNYVWADNEGVHVEVNIGEGGNEFTFEHTNGVSKLRLPTGGDIVDSSGNSVLGGSGSTGSFIFEGSNLSLNEDGDSDMYIKALDDLYLDALNDDIHIRANDDIRLRSGYNFDTDSYPYELRFTNNGDLVFYDNANGNTHGEIDMIIDGGTSQRVLSIVGNERVHITTDLENTEKTWKFDTNGNLTLPEGGDIKDSTGNSVLGGGAGGFTKATVAGQNDILAAESGNTLELVAGDGIAITTNDSDGTITISAASNTTPQYGYFSELVETSSSNQVNTLAVVMDSDGNSYVSFTYWNDSESRDFSGVAKYDSTGEQLWAVNLASQNPDARELNIRSLEFATVDGDPSLIAVGYYYDNNANKDVAFMYYVNPMTGSVGEPLVDCELVAQTGMNVRDGVAGYDGSNTYAVVVGETYDQTLTKTFTPLAGSTTDKLYVSWADFAASGVNTGEGVYYVVGPNQYGVTMNAVGVSATTAGSTDPSWAGISITVSKNEAGNYTITGVNGWGYLVNSWPNPVTLTVPGSALGGVDGPNDLTFDFSNVIFDNNSNNFQAAISNIMGTPPAGVYCPGWGGYDWGTQIGNALNFNYQLNNQAYIARFGQTAAWTKNFGGGSYDRLNSVVVDDSQNVYAVGYVWNGSRGGLVIKYDIDGNQQWAVYINPANNTGNTLMSVDLLSDGNIIAVDEDGVITKLNSSDGSIMWQVKADNGPSWDSDFRGTATPDGDYIITNYEDDNYTQYVMRVSGVDGSSVWNKRISRTSGGDNGEVTSNDDGQYIDCNATHLTIAGRTDPPGGGNTVGLVYSFPITGDNVNGTYGQYVISSESMSWETLSTTSIAATVTNTDISVTVDSVSPTSSPTYVTTSTITKMGGEPVVEPTVIEWTNPNDNVWRIETYNGGAAVQYYSGDNYSAKWFDIANHTSGSGHFRGAIIQYHAFIQNRGTIIGTIHLANDYSQQQATHTEHLSGDSDLQFVTLWDCNNERGQLFFKMTNEQNWEAMIQWTSTVFYGQESND